MMYVTPVLLLIDRLVATQIAKNRADKLAEQTAATASVLANETALQAMKVAAVVKAESRANAEASAELTAAKLEAPGEKMDVIHGLVNGTLTLERAKVEALTLELARLKEAQSKPPKKA
jgi:hypothetical protein